VYCRLLGTHVLLPSTTLRAFVVMRAVFGTSDADSVPYHRCILSCPVVEVRTKLVEC
jgi:hypothetical protein